MRAALIPTGFIGLGSQGAPIARRMLEAGYPLSLWARRPATLASFGETTARVVPSIAALGAAAGHVGICVVNDADVREVCAELLPAMRAGSRIAIHATVHPRTCIALAAEAAARGIGLIDAPVSGGASAAAAGTLTVMVGGADADVAAARPVLETFAGLLVHLGGVGAGQAAKLVNNALMAAHMALAHQALTAAAALGIDRAALVDLVRVSSGRSYGFEIAARQASPMAFAHGARLLAKDLALLGDLLGVETAAFQALEQAATPYLDLAGSTP